MKNRLFLIMVFIICGVVFAVNYSSSDGPGNLTYPNKHNLSATSGLSAYKAATETQICVFCHTPHSALTTPLWNHLLGWSTGFIWYSSPTLLSSTNKVDGDSRLCLSCHDGTVSLGAVQNLGATSTTVNMGTVGFGPLTSSDTSAYIGTNLSGHHPISIELNATLRTDKDAQCAASLVSWTLLSNINRQFKKGTNNCYPTACDPELTDLSHDGVQCTSCHDPHYDWTVDVSKFLRAGATPLNTDSLCCSCHINCSGGCP